MFGAKRVSDLPEGLDFSALQPAAVAVNRDNEVSIFTLFLGPHSRFSLTELLAMLRFTLRESGEIFKEDSLHVFQAEIDLRRFCSFGFTPSGQNPFVASSDNIRVKAVVNSPQLPSLRSIPTVFHSLFDGNFEDDTALNWTVEGRRFKWTHFRSDAVPLVQSMTTRSDFSDSGAFPIIPFWFFSLKEAKNAENSVWASLRSRTTPTILRSSKGWKLADFVATYPSFLTALSTPFLTHEKTFILLPTNESFNELFNHMVTYTEKYLKARFWPIKSRRFDAEEIFEKWLEEQVRVMTEEEIYDLFCRFVRGRVLADGFFSACALPTLQRFGYDLDFTPAEAIYQGFQDPALEVRMTVAATVAPDPSMFWNFPKTTLDIVHEVVDTWPEFTRWFKQQVLDQAKVVPQMLRAIENVKKSIEDLPKLRTTLSKVAPSRVEEEPSDFSTLLIPTDPYESTTMSRDAMTEAKQSGDLKLAQQTLLWRMQSRRFFLPVISEHLETMEVLDNSPLTLRLKALKATISTFPDSPELCATMADAVVNRTGRLTHREEQKKWLELTESLQTLVSITNDEWSTQYATRLCQLRRERLRQSNPRITQYMVERMVPELPVRSGPVIENAAADSLTQCDTQPASLSKLGEFL